MMPCVETPRTYRDYAPSAWKVNSRKFVSRNGHLAYMIRFVLALRACADRAAAAPLEKRAQSAQSSGELPSFPVKERICARASTLPHRTYMATICCPFARKGGLSSSGMPSSSHTRPSHLREAHPGFGVRLCLRKDR